MTETKELYARVWKEYEKCLDFNNRINLLESVKTNENFFIGKQWEGVESNGLPTPIFNFLKQITLHQVATITSDNLTMRCTPLKAAANDDGLKRLTDIVNDEFVSIFEHNKIVTKLREMMRNAAVNGDGCTYSYWDSDLDSIKTEVLENTRVFFGNPNDRQVQTQPYILIARRRFIDEIKDYAAENGCAGAKDAIKADVDENNSLMDSYVDDKCTVILKLWRDKKTKSIHAVEVVKGAVIRKEWDLGINLYPITWLNWDYVQDCYHGQALITGLIPNQQATNKAYAMSILSMMLTAFPKYIYDKTRIQKWSNQVGTACGVNGSTEGAASILSPAQISPQVSQLIQSIIENTQSFTGATSAALGNTRPDNTSAIIALQRAASIPSEITKQNLYQCIEDLGRIYIQFMGEYYGTREVDAQASDLMEGGADILQFAGMAPDVKIQIPFDFSQLKNVPLSLKLDVGASSYWSEIASMQTLDNLLQMHMIDIVDYLERIPDGYISDRQGLLAKYKAMQGAAMQPAPSAAHGDSGASPDELPVMGGSGNGQLQRAVAQGGKVSLV